jgi:hypothetical protein
LTDGWARFRPFPLLPPFFFTFLLHVHLLDLLAVEDLDGDLVAGQDVLRDFDL